MRNKKVHAGRAGFTLVEMLLVIAIISVLISLIVGASWGAVRRAKEGAQRAEISQLETAIVAFKAKFGVEPPSGIKLYEKPTDWQTDLPSTALIRRIWPQFDFSIARDINRNGVANERLSLDGAECLLFFLGGTIDDGKSLAGFSASPIDPFATSLGPTGAKNRIGPFFEFKIDRFQDSDNDGIREYQGYLAGAPTDPIVYYSSYEGRGFVSTDEYVSPILARAFAVYTQPGAANSAGVPFKAQSFQIVAPGWDGVLGYGGNYDPQNPETSLAVGRPSTANTPNYLGRDEFDNVTNFQSGKLKP